MWRQCVLTNYDVLYFLMYDPVVVVYTNRLFFQIAVYHHDGSRYSAMRYRQVAIQTSVRRRSGASIVMEETRLVIPEDSIVRYSFTPGPEDQAVTVSVRRL